MENQQLLIKKAKRLTILSIVLFWPSRIISYVYSITEFMGNSLLVIFSNQSNDLGLLVFLVYFIAKIAIVASFIILIVARNKYKQYAFSRVMMKIHLVMEYIGLLLTSSVVFESCSRMM